MSHTPKLEAKVSGLHYSLLVDGKELHANSCDIKLKVGYMAEAVIGMHSTDLSAFLRDAKLCLVVFDPKTKKERTLRDVHFADDGFE